MNRATPKLTIKGGAACLKGGDTLIVSVGIYEEALVDVIPSGTAGNPTNVRSETPRGATIRPKGNSDLGSGYGAVRFSGKSYINFDGFTVDGQNLTGVYLVYPAYSAENYTSTPSHHIAITNNDLKNGHAIDSTSSMNGIVITVGIHHITVSGNSIYNIGMDALPTDTLWSNGGACISIGSIYAGPDSTAVRNNICWQNGADAVAQLNDSNSVIVDNFFGNPMFVDPASGDFGLRAGSPAMGRGAQP